MDEIKNYAEGYYQRLADDRYPRLRAWEFLWDHLQSFPSREDVASSENLEKTALHLGFYLANWGMLRGSSKLLNVNVKFFEDLVSYLFVEIKSDFWGLELTDFTEENNETLKSFDDFLDKLCSFEKNRISWTDTLVTKILLGIWGQCPARDTNFNKGFNKFCKVNGYSRPPKKLSKFLCYVNSIREKEGWNFSEYCTIEKNRYPFGKLIDMAFFEYGDRFVK